jgi:hypothetical protein
VAKRQSFADKSSKKSHAVICPVCGETIQYIRHVKAEKADHGGWKYRHQNLGVCKCNTKEIYG